MDKSCGLDVHKDSVFNMYLILKILNLGQKKLFWPDYCTYFCIKPKTMIKHSFISIIVMCVLCLTITPLHASDSLEKKMKAYPNPIDRGALITIEMPDNRSEMTVVLYNTVGKVIQTIKTSNNKVSFHVPETSGIYLLRLVEKQKVVEVIKIVVKE